MPTKADARLRIGADVTQAKKAVSTLQGDVSNLNGTVKSGQERIEKFATAVTGSASVLGGLGSKAGATAGAVSNLATAFLAGGPLLAGMALATSAASALVSAFQEIDENTHQADGAFKALGKQLQSTAKNEILQTQKAIADLETQLRNFGLSTTEIALANAEARDAAQRMALETIGEDLPGRESRLAILEQELDVAKRAGVSGAIERLTEQVNLERNIVSNLKIRKQFNEESIKQNTVLIDKLNDQLDTLEAQAKQTKERNKSSKARSEQEAEETQQQLAFIAAIQRQYGQVDKNIEEARKQREREAEERAQAMKKEFEELDSFNKEQAALEKEKADKIIAEIKRVEQFRNVIAGSEAQIAELEIQLRQFEHVETAKTFLLERELRKRQEQQERYAELGNKVWQESVSFLTSVTQQLFDQMLDVLEDFAAGQKVAFDELAAAFVRQIGTQIFSVGLRTFSEGVALAPTLLLPGGQVNAPAVAAHLGAGTALMATGGAMAASGAVAQGVMRRNASTGGGGGALGGGALAPRGGTGGGVGQPSDREAVVINFNGGTQLGDPTERALTMARDQRRARRTVYMPRGG